MHLHTKATKWESSFAFDLEKLKEYVADAELDCIAVTNHNVFDLNQYSEIRSAVPSCRVLPGIEVSLESGHLLLISDFDTEEDFHAKCEIISNEIQDVGQSMTFERLQEILGDLNDYLLIPHYDKTPDISPTALSRMKDFFSAGEVSSVKKYIYAMKSPSSPTPVLFSDARIQSSLNPLPTRQIFINLNDISVSSIKHCLADKSKVTLTENDGNALFYVDNRDLKISTGLTIILGDRSSGKTYTMNRMNESFENAQYIRQFELLEHDEKRAEQAFSDAQKSEHSIFVAEFLQEFKNVVDEVAKIDLQGEEDAIDNYLTALKKYAAERDREDAYSKANLFNADSFNISKSGSEIEELIQAVSKLIDVKDSGYKELINNLIDDSVLKALVTRLIEQYRKESVETNKKKWVNELTKLISNGLQSKSANTSIPEIDLGAIYMNRQRVKKYEYICAAIKKDRKIAIEDYSGFKIVATIEEYTGAGQLKAESGRQMTFSPAFAKYKNPYDYLRMLMEITELPRDDYYKYFVKVEYQILNQYGLSVSGGERAEFNLLKKIKDALKHDILLIDEPESSFDNIFLRENVNLQIKEKSETLPVVVVTHNNTVGASIKADYVLYTKREIVNGKPQFSIYSGYPSDKQLLEPQGNAISNFTIIMDSLEAGDVAYQERKNSYEILKN